MFSNTKYSKEVLIDSLTVVKEKALSGEFAGTYFGICRNWSEEIEDTITYNLVEKLSIGWEYHTQCTEYPVPDNEDLGLWESDNLALRLSLIDYILKRLEEVNQEWLDKLYEEVYSE